MIGDILSDEETLLLTELKDRLSNLLGKRLIRFVLFGSKARGDYDAESDKDSP